MGQEFKETERLDPADIASLSIDHLLKKSLDPESKTLSADWLRAIKNNEIPAIPLKAFWALNEKMKLRRIPLTLDEKNEARERTQGRDNMLAKELREIRQHKKTRLIATTLLKQSLLNGRIPSEEEEVELDQLLRYIFDYGLQSGIGWYGINYAQFVSSQGHIQPNFNAPLEHHYTFSYHPDSIPRKILLTTKSQTDKFVYMGGHFGEAHECPAGSLFSLESTFEIFIPESKQAPEFKCASYVHNLPIYESLKQILFHRNTAEILRDPFGNILAEFKNTLNFFARSGIYIDTQLKQVIQQLAGKLQLKAKHPAIYDFTLAIISRENSISPDGVNQKAQTLKASNEEHNARGVLNNDPNADPEKIIANELVCSSSARELAFEMDFGRRSPCRLIIAGKAFTPPPKEQEGDTQAAFKLQLAEKEISPTLIEYLVQHGNSTHLTWLADFILVPLKIRSPYFNEFPDNMTDAEEVLATEKLNSILSACNVEEMNIRILDQNKIELIIKNIVCNKKAPPQITHEIEMVFSISVNEQGEVVNQLKNYTPRVFPVFYELKANELVNKIKNNQPLTSDDKKIINQMILPTLTTPNADVDFLIRYRATSAIVAEACRTVKRHSNHGIDDIVFTLLDKEKITLEDAFYLKVNDNTLIWKDALLKHALSHPEKFRDQLVALGAKSDDSHQFLEKLKNVPEPGKLKRLPFIRWFFKEEIARKETADAFIMDIRREKISLALDAAREEKIRQALIIQNEEMRLTEMAQGLWEQQRVDTLIDDNKKHLKPVLREAAQQAKAKHRIKKQEMRLTNMIRGMEEQQQIDGEREAAHIQQEEMRQAPLPPVLKPEESPRSARAASTSHIIVGLPTPTAPRATPPSAPLPLKSSASENTAELLSAMSLSASPVSPQSQQPSPASRQSYNMRADSLPNLFKSPVPPRAENNVRKTPGLSRRDSVTFTPRLRHSPVESQ